MEHLDCEGFLHQRASCQIRRNPLRAIAGGEEKWHLICSKFFGNGECELACEVYVEHRQVGPMIGEKRQRIIDATRMFYPDEAKLYEHFFGEKEEHNLVFD